jgi:hypothetical protein
MLVEAALKKTEACPCRGVGGLNYFIFKIKGMFQFSYLRVY